MLGVTHTVDKDRQKIILFFVFMDKKKKEGFFLTLKEQVGICTRSFKVYNMSNIYSF